MTFAAIRDTRVQGCLHMLAAMFCFSVMNTLIHALSLDLPTTQIVFLRNLISVCLLMPWVVYVGRSAIKTERLSGHFWRAGLGIISMELWFYSLAHLNLSLATALSFTTPIFVTLAAVFFLKEKTDWRRLCAIGIGLLGILIVFNPWEQRGEGLSVITLLALVSFVITATTSILVKTLTRTERAGTIVFYMALFMTPLSAIPAWFNWHSLTNEHLFLAMLIAFFSTCGHFLLTKAYSMAEMTLIIPIDFTRFIFTGILAYVCFGQGIDIRTIIGAILILSGAVISATINASEMHRRIEEESLSDVKE